MIEKLAITVIDKNWSEKSLVKPGIENCLSHRQTCAEQTDRVLPWAPDGAKNDAYTVWRFYKTNFMYLSEVFISSPNAGDLIEIEMKMIDL